MSRPMLSAQRPVKSARSRAILLAFSLLTLVCGCNKPSEGDGDSAANPEATKTSNSTDEGVPVSTTNSQETSAETQEASKADEGHGGVKRETPNRLAKETSPYLLLHAHNPVDWYPWGPEALEKAKKEGKLIFLSVGYSSCHWCHVMEREAFSDPEVAEFLNKFFVCIKVDREERPDIDHIYMNSLYVFNQLSGIGGGGGWPLSMFLTPEAKPFFGGTYLPARDGDRGVQTGFLTLIKRIQSVWKEQPKTLRADAERVTQVTKLQLAGDRPNPLFRLDRAPYKDGLESLARQFDPDHGGFGFAPSDSQRPKFPEPSNLLLLLEQLRLDPDDTGAKSMLVKTLDKLYQGGIYDQLGGGFHRYSVDRFWHIPHFEKMLYDNAQLISVYARAYELTSDPAYRRIVQETIDYSVRELRDPDGGFWSAMDADSEGEEGKFYRWTDSELRELIDSDQAWATAAATWGVGGEPNFEEKYYVLLMARSLSETADLQKVSLEKWQSQLQPIRDKLLEYRAERERPLTDTKILTSWNGMMIRGLADAGRILENPEYLKLAEQAADYVLTQLVDEEGRLYRTQSGGQPILKAYVDDYANLVDGLIGLYEATGEERWLKEAERLNGVQLDLFWDEENGGFFYTADDHESLLARAKNPVDNVVPSGNSVSATNLIYLGNKLDQQEWLDKAETTIRSVTSLLQQSPAAVPRMLIATNQYLEVRPDRLQKPLSEEPAGDEAEGDKAEGDKAEGDEPKDESPEGDTPDGDKSDGDNTDGDN